MIENVGFGYIWFRFEFIIRTKTNNTVDNLIVFLSSIFNSTIISDITLLSLKKLI